MFDVVARLGGDITAGTFETLGDTQVGRVALSAPHHDVERLARGLREAGLHVEGRVARLPQAREVTDHG